MYPDFQSCAYVCISPLFSFTSSLSDVPTSDLILVAVTTAITDELQLAGSWKTKPILFFPGKLSGVPQKKDSGAIWESKKKALIPALIQCQPELISILPLFLRSPALYLPQSSVEVLALDNVPVAPLAGQ